MNFYILLVYFINIVYCRSNNNYIKCQTPDYKPGLCIPIKECNFIIDIIKNTNITERIKNQLRNYKCDANENITGVCCPHPNLYLINQYGCGYIERSKLFSAGQVELNEYRWSVLLSYNTEHGLKYLCGGSVINSNYILTSAHCLQDLPNLNSVRVGEHDISKETDCSTHFTDECLLPAKDITISEIISHPDYDPITLDNNIGLVRLSQSINISEYNVDPICLPIGTRYSQCVTTPCRLFSVNGWGANYFANQSNILLLAWYPIIPIETCQQAYADINPKINIGMNQICVNETNVKKFEYCVGERGDSFHARVSGGTGVQYGIMSYGAKYCANQKQPKILTNIVPYLYWILDNIK